MDGKDEGGPVIEQATGLGIGYSVGGGITLPVASIASIVFFGNYNVGRYDLVAPAGVLQRNAKHRYAEAGIGLTIR